MRLKTAAGVGVGIMMFIWLIIPNDTPDHSLGVELDPDIEAEVIASLEASRKRIRDLRAVIDRELDAVSGFKMLPGPGERARVQDGGAIYGARASYTDPPPRLDRTLAATPPPRRAVAPLPPPPPPPGPTRPPELPQIGSPGAAIKFPPDKETMTMDMISTTPILVIACNRETVRRSLDKLIEYRPSEKKFPIIVSQDCAHKPTAAVIRSYAPQGVVLIEQPDLSDPPMLPKAKKWELGYYKIARHYKFALTTLFNMPERFDSVIIVEDDLDVAPDFYEFFAAGKRLLETDKTLYCVSSWNDNGKPQHVHDNKALYRTDFFGGLGWMILRDLWDNELKDKWTDRYWDDWFRLPEQRKGRSCIRPEVARTTTFGKIGVSKGQFYKKYLQFIRLNDVPVKFIGEGAVSTASLLKENYDSKFLAEVDALPQTTQLELDQGVHGTNGAYRLEYSDNKHFARIAKKLEIMEDTKSGVPRTAYLGVVQVWWNGIKLYIAPEQPWKGYVD